MIAAGRVPVRNFEQFKVDCAAWQVAYDSKDSIQEKNSAAKLVADRTGHRNCAFVQLCGQQLEPAK